MSWFNRCLPWPSRRAVHRQLAQMWEAIRLEADATTTALTEMRKTMATQADIDALTTKLSDMKDHLTSADAGIQAEIDALKAANPAVDVTALQSAVDALSGQVDATAALVPAPVEPPPAA